MPAFFFKTAIFIVISPVLGMVLGRPAHAPAHDRSSVIRSPSGVDRTFRRLQLVSAALYSLGHGGNDAQKTMGIIVAALVATGHLVVAPGRSPRSRFGWCCSATPRWGSGRSRADGASCGRWGCKITKLAPVGGFCAETSGAATLFLATSLGVPVSTTHTITGAIVGTGSVRKLSAVRWGVAGRIVWAWVLTVPCAAAMSALAYVLATSLGLER